MKYRIKAWGAHDKPDISYESDDYPTDLTWRCYPCVSVQMLQPISRDAIQIGLDAYFPQLLHNIENPAQKPSIIRAHMAG